MPEGDTIFKAARTLHRALAGQTVTRFETVLVELDRVNIDTPLAGRAVESVTAAGKHLLIAFSGALVLRTHMRMNGSWHIYRPGERWQLPRSLMRIAIETGDWIAVAFRVHEAEFVRAHTLDREGPVARLGPDLLGAGFDQAEALTRIRARGDEPIAEVLLNQRVMAGIGNVFKSEILFLAGVHPETATSALSDEQLIRIVELSRKLLLLNVRDGAAAGIETYRGLRRTTGRMKPEDRLWVYSRGGKACRKCGSAIGFKKTGDDARVTYWCPRCQS